MVDMINIDRSLSWASRLLYDNNKTICNLLNPLVARIEHRAMYPEAIDEDHEGMVTWR